MANLTTFSNLENILKFKFEINFGTGFENWTTYLESFDFFQELSEVSYGICQTEAFFGLRIPNPETKWTLPGLPIKFTVSITDDGGASYFDYVIFEGKSGRKSTLTNQIINIKANDRLHELLGKKPPVRGQLANGLSLELNSLITNTWPGQAYSFNDRYNFSINYLQSDTTTLGEQILEFAKVSACLVIFENNTINFVNPFRIAISKFYTIEGDISLSKIGIGDYNSNATLDKKEYFNVFIATAYQYIFALNFFLKSFTGHEIFANSTIFFEIDLEDILVISISSAFLTFRSGDQDNSPTVGNVAIQALDIIADNKVLVKFRNNNAFTVFFKKIELSGLALFKTGTFSKTWENTAQIAADGERIVFEIDSKVAQDELNLINLVEIQQAWTKEWYEFKCAWSPNFKVGKVITARTPQNGFIHGLITKVEAGVSISDPRLTAKIRIRRFNP